MASVRPILFLLITTLIAIATEACAPGGAPTPEPKAEEMVEAMCDCELRSWVVAGRGRHLFIEIDCPPEFDSLDGVVEFANTAMRRDFDWTLDPDGAARNARMEIGERVFPPFGEPDNRLEASFELPVNAALCLQRDRLYDSLYFILGPNSNSMMRAACESCEVELPEHILNGFGVFGEFPGIDMSPGDEIPADQWRGYGWLESSP